MTDLISRADAIEALGEEPEIILDTDAEWEMHDRWVDAMTSMKALPSAVCDDCIWHVCNYNNVDWDTPHQPMPKKMSINWYQVIMNGIIIGLLLLILMKVR